MNKASELRVLDEGVALLNYVSTRGQGGGLGFSDVLIEGLAPDGGLYMPETWPTTPVAASPPPSTSSASAPSPAENVDTLDSSFSSASAPHASTAAPPAEALGYQVFSYQAFASEVMWPFVKGSFSRQEFDNLVANAYKSFSHPDITPLVPLEGHKASYKAASASPVSSFGAPNVSVGASSSDALGAPANPSNIWLLELFWGPTLAFKDVALQLLGQLFDAELAKRGDRVTIIGATSGDTGSAAIEACRDRQNIDIFILHPNGRVSETQRRQMTTVDSPTVHNIALNGSFDNCQDMVKALFADTQLKQQLKLSSINSINWARVMAQIVYYFRAASAIQAESQQHAPNLAVPVTFVVPTGNFGNVFAGYAAYRMGLNARFLVGTNINDSLAQFFETAVLATGEVKPTLSPSMDIMIPSNLERLLFELFGRDGFKTTEFMNQVRSDGKAFLPPVNFADTEGVWSAHSCDDATTLQMMRQVYEQTGRLIDPHTAVGLAAAQSPKGQRLRQDGSPAVVLATAHPAKFPEAVKQATGETPVLPDFLADLHQRKERYTVLENDFATVRRFIASRASK